MKGIIIIFVTLIIILAGASFAQNIFNIQLELPETYHYVQPGQTVYFTTKLMNLENTNRVDVRLTYALVTAENITKNSRSETVAVETQASFVGNLKVPDDLQFGRYTLRVTVQTAFGVSSAETFISVSPRKDNSLIFTGIAILLLIALIILLAKRMKPTIEKIKLKNKIRNIVRKKTKSP